MSKICPVCNGMVLMSSLHCPDCKRPLIDYGQTDDYLDSYSPYRLESMPLTTDELALTTDCRHLGYCPECDKVHRANIGKIKF